jgi:hypothetical protein
MRRAATLTWARPLALFTSVCDFGAPPEIVRLAWARSWRPLFGAYFAGSMARRILRFQPPSFVSYEVRRPLPAQKNSSATKVEMQAGNARGHGDETGDGAYGTRSRPSHGSDTIPSTIGAIPASKGLSGAAALTPPPMVICVPFVGPAWPLS